MSVTAFQSMLHAGKVTPSDTDTEGGGDGVIATVNTLDEQQRWACWVERRLNSASHKKYRHAAVLKRLEPGDNFRHHVGVVDPSK